jgi:ABC-2 type transport system permease protein
MPAESLAFRLLLAVVSVLSYAVLVQFTPLIEAIEGVPHLNTAFHLLIGAIFDTARWPVHVFRGVWRVVFTFVFPIAVMTTYPAMALLGELDAETALATLGGAAALLLVSRLVWRTAIRNYTSASS